MTDEAPGLPAPLAEICRAPALAVPLRAGPLRLLFDRGELRFIRLGEREVLRGIYFALREPGWASVPGTIEDLLIEAEPESFRIRFVSRHRRGEVAFDWQARVEGGSDGRIVYLMDGEAGSTFRRNRLGLCVLHPVAECAGQACVVETVEGERRSGVFPREIAPFQPFLGLRAIAHQAAPGVEAEVRMEGDVFEMEDQRNWSDASFKTYSTPLALPHPVEVACGTRIQQSVSLCLFGETSEPVREAAASVPGALPQKRNGTEPVAVQVDPTMALPRPAIGLAGAELVGLDQDTAARLRALRLDHLRADLHLESPGWEQALARAVANARLLELPLELALFLPDDPDATLHLLAARSRELELRVASWLLFRAADGTTADGMMAAGREALSPVDGRALFGGGTDQHFLQLNRRRPSAAGCDRISFALTPQAHACDDRTLIDNLASLCWLAETARGLAPAASLSISPVTLRPRVDPGPLASHEAKEPPFTDDPRQSAPFAAAWTLGFVAAAAEAGIASLTFFELTGPRGVMDGRRVFPVHLALQDLAALPGATVAPSRSRRPERVQTLALRHGRRTRLFLANVAEETHPVRVEGLRGAARCAALGELEGRESGFELELGPGAVLRVDVESDEPLQS